MIPRKLGCSSAFPRAMDAEGLTHESRCEVLDVCVCHPISRTKELIALERGHVPAMEASRFRSLRKLPVGYVIDENTAIVGDVQPSRFLFSLVVII